MTMPSQSPTQQFVVMSPSQSPVAMDTLAPTPSPTSEAPYTVCRDSSMFEPHTMLRRFENQTCAAMQARLAHMNIHPSMCDYRVSAADLGDDNGSGLDEDSFKESYGWLIHYVGRKCCGGTAGNDVCGPTENTMCASPSALLDNAKAALPPPFDAGTEVDCTELNAVQASQRLNSSMCHQLIGNIPEDVTFGWFLNTVASQCCIDGVVSSICNHWTPNEHQPTCPPGEHFTCLDSPCARASCPRVPEAMCVENYCGGCNAEWYRPNGERVRDDDCDHNPRCPTGTERVTAQGGLSKCRRLCKAGQERVGFFCRAQCDANMERVGKRCRPVCPIGMQRLGHRCVPRCSPGQIRVGNRCRNPCNRRGVCFPDCGSEARYLHRHRRCKCNNNMKMFDNATNTCVDRYTISAVRCEDGTSYEDGLRHNCQCRDGKYWTMDFGPLVFASTEFIHDGESLGLGYCKDMMIGENDPR